MLNKRISTHALVMSLIAISFANVGIVDASESKTNTSKVELSDVNGHWAQKEIEYFYNKGVLTVITDTEIKPNKTVTRGEFVVFMNRVLGLENAPIDDDFTFTDVSVDSPYACDIAKALKLGCISKSDKFRPNDAITRQEAAVIITNIYKNKDTNLNRIANYKDSEKVSEWAKTSIEGCIEAGYIKGNSKELRPLDKLTRAEMATLFYNATVEPGDIKGHWAEKEIKFFTERNQLKVYEDNTVRPELPVSRAEFVVFVNRVFEYDKLHLDKSLGFEDVSSTVWYADDISKALSAGYIAHGEKFRPNDAITRQEAAVIISNIFKNKDSKFDKLETFPDYKDVSSWAKESMEGCIESGYIIGRKGELKPTEKLTRAEMATILYRAYNKPYDLKTHWGCEAMEYYLQKNMISVYEDNTIRPNKTVTRAEFISFTNRVMGYDKTPVDKSIKFTDVKSDAWYANDVSIAAKLGYISQSDKFRPNDAITRQEAVVIITNILHNKDTNMDKIANYADAKKVASWAETSMEGALEAKIIVGYDFKELRPTNKVTRAEMATMFFNAEKNRK